MSGRNNLFSGGHLARDPDLERSQVSKPEHEWNGASSFCQTPNPAAMWLPLFSINMAETGNKIIWKLKYVPDYISRNFQEVDVLISFLRLIWDYGKLVCVCSRLHFIIWEYLHPLPQGKWNRDLEGNVIEFVGVGDTGKERGDCEPSHIWSCVNSGSLVPHCLLWLAVGLQGTF